MSNPDDGGARVELVDRAGRTIGPLRKLYAHPALGRLHRAISVFLLDRPDRWLVQRRAVGKCRPAAMWNNTFCGHPRPHERPNAAASRRLAAELGLGVEPDDLVDGGTLMDQIADRASLLLEREYDNLSARRGRIIRNLTGPRSRRSPPCRLRA